MYARRRAMRPSFALLPLLLLPLLALAASSGTAHGFPRLGLELGTQGQRSADGSFDLVGVDDSWSRFHAGLGLGLTSRLRFWLGYQYGGAQAPLLGLATGETELTTHSGEASLTYSVELGSWLRPYARLGGGLVAGRLDLTLPDGERREGWAYAPCYFLTGGLLITPPFVSGMQLRDSGLLSETTLGLELEAGYAEVGELLFDQMAAGSGPSLDGASIRRPDLDLGALALSGWTWRVAFVALF